MMTELLFGLLIFVLLLGPLGLTPNRLALRKEYLRLLSDARQLLLQHSVRRWPDELAKWHLRAKFAPWFLLRQFAGVTKSKLGGMGSLGDVVLFHDDKLDEKQISDCSNL